MGARETRQAQGAAVYFLHRRPRGRRRVPFDGEWKDQEAFAARFRELSSAGWSSDIECVSNLDKASQKVTSTFSWAIFSVKRPQSRALVLPLDGLLYFRSFRLVAPVSESSGAGQPLFDLRLTPHRTPRLTPHLIPHRAKNTMAREDCP